MIRLSNKFGRKIIFANIYKNNESTNVSTTQYLHDTQHTKYKDFQYKICATNIVTKAEVCSFLTLESKNVRGAYLSFVMGISGLNVTELGTYKYTIYAMSSAGMQEKVFEVDRGLLHIYNNDTFTEPYIKPDVEVIPATKVYKPS